MSKKAFVFYKDWILYLENMGVEEKAEFLEVILAYQNWKNVDPKTGFKFIRPKIKSSMDNDKEKRKKKAETSKENWKKWWRPKKKKKPIEEENNPKEPSRLKWNPENLVTVTVTDTVTVTEKEEYNNITSKDVKATPIEKKKEYWNRDINLLVEIIKEKNGWICWWTKAKQRQFWKHLLGSLQKIKKVSGWEYSWDSYLKSLLDVISRNEFHSHKISWPEKIYRNLAELVLIANQTVKKQSKAKITTFNSI